MLHLILLAGKDIKIRSVKNLNFLENLCELYKIYKHLLTVRHHHWKHNRPRLDREVDISVAKWEVDKDQVHSFRKYVFSRLFNKWFCLTSYLPSRILKKSAEIICHWKVCIKHLFNHLIIVAHSSKTLSFSFSENKSKRNSKFKIFY